MPRCVICWGTEPCRGKGFPYCKEEKPKKNPDKHGKGQ